MIDQRQHRRFARAFGHPTRFITVHGHRFFAEHGLAVLQRCERHLAMRDNRCDDAD